MTPADAGQDELHPFMTVVEVAAALRVSRATIYRLVNRGILPGMRVGNSVRVSRQAIDSFISNARST